ncbi:hypothetical protein TNCV_3579631 [Trichonephila clavipes]|nr:hypothetical protein TNCV_3579631 [Trichonephila clavipes]
MVAKVLSFLDQKVLSSNLPSLMTLAVQRGRNLHAAVVAPSIHRKCNQAVIHLMQPTKPSHTNDATHKPSNTMTQLLTRSSQIWYRSFAYSPNHW